MVTVDGIDGYGMDGYCMVNISILINATNLEGEVEEDGDGAVDGELGECRQGGVGADQKREEVREGR
jgi:hypothetical protein